MLDSSALLPSIGAILTADRDAHGIWHFAIESMRFGEDEEPLERIDELLRGRACVTYNGRGFDATGLRLGWLHGYCLLTLRYVGADLTIDGEVRIGSRYGENAALTQHLADALEPGAVLAGCDLTGIIGQLDPSCQNRGQA